MRDGDRFYYANIFSPSEVRAIERSTLAEIIQRSTEVTGLQKNVFFFRAEASGQFTTAAPLGAGDQHQNNQRHNNQTPMGVANVTLELLSSDGDVIATTTTDGRGKYRFRDFEETDAYQVRLAETGDTLELLINTGDQRIRGLDFSLESSSMG